MIIRSAGQIGPSPGIGLPSPRPRGVSQAAPGFGPYGGFQGARRRVRGGAKAWSPADLASTLTYWDFRQNRTITSAPDIDSVAAVSGSTAPNLTAGTVKPHAVSGGAEFAVSTNDRFLPQSQSGWDALHTGPGSLYMLMTTPQATTSFPLDGARGNSNLRGLSVRQASTVFDVSMYSGTGTPVWVVSSSNPGTSSSFRLFECHWDSSSVELLIDGTQVDSKTGSYTYTTLGSNFGYAVGTLGGGPALPYSGVMRGLLINFGAALSEADRAHARQFMLGQA